MPAEVSVTGELPLDALEPGSLVRFQADGDIYVRCQDDFHRLADNEGKLAVHFRRAR